MEVAFGPLVGFLTGFLVWSSCVLAAASVASALAQEFAVTSGALVVAALLYAWRRKRGLAPLVQPA